jgi:hypothetical protein
MRPSCVSRPPGPNGLSARGDVRIGGDALERGLDPRAPAGSRSVPVRAVDELVRVALGGREVLGEQVVGALALGAGQPEATRSPSRPTLEAITWMTTRASSHTPNVRQR